jgi:tetratricopeptide (TPR) repeat protein
MSLDSPDPEIDAVRHAVRRTLAASIIACVASVLPSWRWRLANHEPRGASPRRFPKMARCLALGAVLGIHFNLLGLSLERARGEDEVRLRGSQGRGEQRLKGEVLEYTGKELLIRRSPGREERYDATRVIEIESSWSDAHQKAEELLAERRASEALPFLRQALEQEARPWVRRRLLANYVTAYRQTGDLEAAVAAFAALLESDPGTPHFSVIPLCWPAPLPSASLESQAANWLHHPSPAIQLVGASWSLTSARRGEAIRCFQRLAEEGDPRIAFLARCQLWRTELVTVTAQDIPGWQALIERMPRDLRAGPYLLLAQAMARTGEQVGAAIEFLRLPILYPGHTELAVEGLWGAGQQLEAVGQNEEAITLYRELIANFPEHVHVARVRQRLNELDASR